MKLSIIIPVYQAEGTLQRCVESLSVGSTDDYEVLLIDDGSTDGTSALCDQMAATDPHIHAMHTTNKGPSAARNAGLAAATGDIIYFADADDYLEKGTLDKMLSLMQDKEKADIVEFPAMIYFQGKRQWLLQLKDETYEDVTDYWLTTKGYSHAYVWNKVYRKQLFGGIRFQEGQIYEDAELIPRLLEKAQSIVTTSKGFYYYCDNPLSLTAQSDPEKLFWLLQAYVRTYKKWGLETNQRAVDFYLMMLNVQLDVFPATGKTILPPPARNWSIREISGISSKIKLICVRILGVKGLCRVYKLKRKVRS